MEDKDKQAEKKWYILDRGSLSLLIVLLAAILFYVGLTNFDVIAVRVRTFMGVLTPFIAGFAFLSESSTKSRSTGVGWRF